MHPVDFYCVHVYTNCIPQDEPSGSKHVEVIKIKNIEILI